MSRSGKERITVRLSNSDIKGLSKIQASGDFEDMSASVRWCLHFTLTMMRMIPAAIMNSFVQTEQEPEPEAKPEQEAEQEVPEIKPDDSMEKPAGEVPAQGNHCTNGGNGGCCNGNCGEKEK